MFEFLRLAKLSEMSVIILDPNDTETIEGELHTKHCVEVCKQVLEEMPASEIFIVAHSYGGASLIDMLGVASEALLARIKGIAFTDSVHFVGENCLQTQE